MKLKPPQGSSDPPLPHCDVLQRGVNDLVVIGEAVKLEGV